MLFIVRCFISIALIILVPLCSWSAKPFRVGVVSGGPHVLIEPGAKFPTGHAPEFFQKFVFPEIAKTFSLEIQWDLSPTSRLLNEIENGRLDMMFLLVKSPEREKSIIFSAEPFLSEPGGVIVNKDFPIENGVIAPEQLEARVMGQMGGTYVPDFFSKYKIKSHPLSGDDIGNRLMNLVGSKRIDAVFVHLHSVTEYILKEHDMGHNLKAVPLSKAVPPFQVYIGFKKSIDPALKKQIDELIQKNIKFYSYKK
ncbi:Bacterial extracellular solute-binding protein, family 3 [compost metagenome]